jgi:hypothetical protein
VRKETTDKHISLKIKYLFQRKTNKDEKISAFRILYNENRMKNN